MAAHGLPIHWPPTNNTTRWVKKNPSWVKLLLNLTNNIEIIDFFVTRLNFKSQSILETIKIREVGKTCGQVLTNSQT